MDFSFDSVGSLDDHLRECRRTMRGRIRKQKEKLGKSSTVSEIQDFCGEVILWVVNDVNGVGRPHD